MDGDLRTATVLFTDVVDSSRLFAASSTPAAKRMRERHFELLATAVQRAHGRQIKTLGDGLMATFAAAGSAVHAAIDIQRAVSEDNRRRPGADVLVRIGLSTGDVSETSGDLFGQAVVEASRLCAIAGPAEILASDSVRVVGGPPIYGLLETLGAFELKGLDHPVVRNRVRWRRHRSDALRVVLADDAVLVREGLARLLQEDGMEVIAQAGDAGQLLELVDALRPDVVITDLRMPPTRTLEGLEAAERIRREAPGVGVVLLTQHLQVDYANRLLRDGAEGIGYLLKERIGDLTEFAAAVRRVASGGCALDPEVAEGLLTQHAAVLPGDEPRRRAVLSMVIEGRSDEEIATASGVDPAAAAAEVASLLAALGVRAAGPERVGSLLTALR